MSYRPLKVEYEHLIFAMMILKSDLNMEVKVSIHEFISFKAIISRKCSEINESISLNIGPSARRAFESNWKNVIDTFYDFSGGLSYSLKSDKYLTMMQSKIFDDLEGHYILDFLTDKNLLLEALNENNIVLAKKRGRFRHYK